MCNCRYGCKKNSSYFLEFYRAAHYIPTDHKTCDFYSNDVHFSSKISTWSFRQIDNLKFTQFHMNLYHVYTVVAGNVSDIS